MGLESLLNSNCGCVTTTGTDWDPITKSIVSALEKKIGQSSEFGEALNLLVLQVRADNENANPIEYSTNKSWIVRFGNADALSPYETIDFSVSNGFEVTIPALIGYTISDVKKGTQDVQPTTTGYLFNPSTGTFNFADEIINEYLYFNARKDLTLIIPDLPDGGDGGTGWSPVFALISDGDRRVLQVSDWTGGTGDKPATGVYIGVSGFTSILADAIDIRGAKGDTGAQGAQGPAGADGADGTGGELTVDGLLDILSDNGNVRFAPDGNKVRADLNTNFVVDDPDAIPDVPEALLSQKRAAERYVTKAEFDAAIQEIYDSMGGYDGPYDAMGTTFVNALKADGMLVSPQLEGAIHKYFIDINSIKSKMRVVNLMVGSNAASHRWNALNPLDTNAAFRALYYGGVTHTATGAMPDGSTGYGDFFYVVANQGHNTSIKFGMSFYSRSDTDQGFDMANTNGGVTGDFLLCNASNSTQSLGLGAYLGSPNLPGNGHFSTVRDGTRLANFRNGVLLTSRNDVPLSTLSTPTSSLKLFWANDGPQYGTKECAYYSVHEGLTDAEVLIEYNAVQAFQTSLNRAV